MMLIRYIRLQYHKPDIWWIRLIVLVISFFAYFMTGEGIIARLIPGYIIWFVCYHVSPKVLLMSVRAALWLLRSVLRD